jgi:hypothetical protein
MQAITSNDDNLLPDTSRVSAPLLLSRFIRMDIRENLHSLKVRLGITRLADIDADTVKEPDTPLAMQARELMEQLSPPYLANHVYRTFCFGMVIAQRNKLTIDRELFYLAAVLHDLGVTEALAGEPGSFEWVGARKAREFCLEKGLNAERADLLYDAIALHSSVCIANRREPEVAMVHYGAGCDLLGLRFGEIPPETMANTLERYPREDFKNAFCDCLAHQVELKPDCHIAGHMGLGMARRVQGTPFSE